VAKSINHDAIIAGIEKKIADKKTELKNLNNDLANALNAKRQHELDTVSAFMDSNNFDIADIMKALQKEKDNKDKAEQKAQSKAAEDIA